MSQGHPAHEHEVPASHDLSEHKGLNEGALTFTGTLMIGLASVAPAYSLASTLGSGNFNAATAKTQAESALKGLLTSYDNTLQKLSCS